MTPATKTPKHPRNRTRCNHLFANHTRCRLFVPNAHARFCVNHAKPSARRASAPDLAVTLTANLDEFKSAEPINDFLSRLLLALAHDRISPRRAAVLAYITNQLLRTVAAIERENDRENDRENEAEVPTGRTFIWDMPHPPREDDGAAQVPGNLQATVSGAAVRSSSLGIEKVPCTQGRVVYRNPVVVPGTNPGGTNGILRYS
jgi:hypothetical protein